MDDLWQGYSDDGTPITSKPITRAEAAVGALNGASHVWIWRSKDKSFEVLLQKRAAIKRTWPGYFDISTAGHIDFRESQLRAAVREAREELGISIEPKDLKEIFIDRSNMVTAGKEGVIENEIIWVYTYRLDKPQQFTLQIEEVESTMWMDAMRFTDLINGKIADMAIVPHGKHYYEKLLLAINNQLV